MAARSRPVAFNRLGRRCRPFEVTWPAEKFARKEPGMAPCDVSSHRLHGAEVNVQGVHPAIDEEEAPMASNSVNGGVR